MAAVQRLRQGFRALFAFSQTVDLELAAQYLSPKLLSLFRQMKRSEQLHSLNVLQDVLAQGSTPHDLAIAALLHDVGKSRYPLAVWQKTASVLVRAMLPNLFHKWSMGNPANMWQRPFVVYVQHPVWSADMLRQADASEAAVWLAAHHADSSAQWDGHPYLPLLRRLQQADNAN
ncbi:MAG: HD domain-containing protein [Anaerolineae bacterium]|nr:HD domain-containing protein [Anaerolineae bacterium]